VASLSAAETSRTSSARARLFQCKRAFARPNPVFRRRLRRIRTAIDDARDAFPKLFADFVEARKAALVFDSVVQQSRDDFILAATVLNDDGGNSE